jgi:hypothetical protein
MVEALDRMVTEGLTAEIEAVVAEKQSLAEDRVQFRRRMTESSTKFNDFMVSKLAEEIGELRRDRKMHSEGFKKLETFIVGALAEEIMEFARDKRDVVETKVRLVREARGQLEKLKARFVTESADKLGKSVAKHLKAEMNQLHEDIKVARENNFGRKIFEAYASEFGSTYLNENAEIRKLSGMIARKNQQLEEATKIVEAKNRIVETKEKEIRIIKESNLRQSTMEELLSPLNEEKREVMQNLLESVQTSRLKGAFEKYLPAVLNDAQPRTRKMVSESVRSVTGDKTVKAAEEEDRSNVIDIKRLAGL